MTIDEKIEKAALDTSLEPFFNVFSKFFNFWV